MPRFSLRRFVSETFDGAELGSFRLCGMDEVGRGAFAGPLVAAAVILPPRFRHPLMRDSKLLSPLQRETVEPIIRDRALACAVVEVPAAEINRRGLGWANVEVFRRLVATIDADGYCCDGNLRIDAVHPVHTLVGGDALIPAISAASIVAKVHRDRLMREMHAAAPHYDWFSNKGYGAPVHRRAIMEFGTHPEHRSVFVASMLQGELELIAGEEPPGESVGAAAGPATTPAGAAA